MNKPAEGEVKGDGGTAAVSEETLQTLKTQTADLAMEASEYVTGDRQDSIDTRFCHWDGQSSDGRKHKNDLGEDPLPFEGASDSRIRLADQIVNEHVDEYLNAVQRVVPQVKGMEGTDGARAAKMRTLLRYYITAKWKDYDRQLELAAQYLEGDSPGVAIMGVYWKRERALRNSTVTPEDIALIYMNSMQEAGQQMDEGMVDYLMEILGDEAFSDELAGIVNAIHPQMKMSRVNKVVKALYTEGEAEFPEPYMRVNMPVMEAHRPFEDIFIPLNTTSLQSARVIVKRDWYSRAGILERAGVDGWSAAFVGELIGDGTEGDKGFISQTAFDDSNDESDLGKELSTGEGRFVGMYEILTAYRREVNDDGIPGVYVYKYSYFTEKPAKDRELLGYAHGDYPFVWFAREQLNKILLDSRGVPEIAHTAQNSLKLHNDALEDHVQVNTNPPAKVPPGRKRMQITLQPFGQIEAGRRDDIEWMSPPAYPKAAESQRDEVKMYMNEYFGRQSATVTPEQSLAAQQARVNKFLGSLTKCLMMVVQLAQQFLDDEEVARIVGGNGLPIARSVEEIAGEYDLELSYDVRDMDMEYLKKKADLFLTCVRPLDQRQTLQYDTIVKRIFESIDPNWAEEAVIEPQMADMRERVEESDDFVKMLNGVRPERPEEGQNHALRLQVLEELIQTRMQNPAAFGQVPPAAQALIQEQVQYRQFQVQQRQNAETGRKGFVEEDLATMEVEQ